MKLKLTKPICFFDLETTGVTIGIDRIVEISVLKINPDGSRFIKTKRINPEMPIPEAATKVHGITDNDVKDAPVFSKIAHELLQLMNGSDLGGYNSNKFDIPMLVEEFMRAGITFDMKGRRLVDVQNIFHKMEPRNLSAAYKFYCAKEIENAHSAEADITATIEILEAQLERYPELKNDIDFLHEFSINNNNVDLAGRIIYNDEGEEVFNFGKHKGKKVVQVFADEPSYYDWMMKGDFPMQTKQVITSLRLRNFSQQKVSTNI
ncbi:MAG: 3'-5' exonuclease [Bacteroidia bacterium]|nr:3'-5' exonuclease [Bacteroidia bacterium]MCZ2277676.1 3'-5' exonuclease [Bacteroidia bacterium]